MAQTIGSLDLNAFSDLYSDSTQYFWFEGNASATYGAGAHVTLVPDTSFISNPTGQNILMNTDGFIIRNGLLPMMVLDNNSLDFNMIDTTAGTYTSAATFGERTRIGREELGYAKVFLSPSIFHFLSSESTSVFKTGVASAETGTSQIEINADWQSSITTGLTFGSYTLNPSASTSINGTFYSSIVDSFDSGTSFMAYIEIDTRYPDSLYSTNWSVENVILGNFIKGTATTISNQVPQEQVTLYYNGAGTFIVSGTFVNISSVNSVSISNNGGYLTGKSEAIQATIYNTTIGGNCFVNQSNGGIYLCLPNKNSYRYADYDLYNAIDTLGWGNEVLVGITLAEHTKTINSSSTLIDNAISFTRITPLSANVVVTSSDTSVISGGSVRYHDDPTNPTYYVALNTSGMSSGVTTITVSITVGDNTYSDSCVVTVT